MPFTIFRIAFHASPIHTLYDATDAWHDILRIYRRRLFYPAPSSLTPPLLCHLQQKEAALQLPLAYFSSLPFDFSFISFAIDASDFSLRAALAGSAARSYAIFSSHARPRSYFPLFSRHAAFSRSRAATAALFSLLPYLAAFHRARSPPV